MYINSINFVNFWIFSETSICEGVYLILFKCNFSISMYSSGQIIEKKLGCKKFKVKTAMWGRQQIPGQQKNSEFLKFFDWDGLNKSGGKEKM